MQYIKQIKNRGAVKKFKNKDLELTVETKVLNILEEANKLYDHKIEFVFFNDSEKVYTELKKYEEKYGEIIYSPQYLLVFTQDERKGYEDTGYVGEWVISRLTALDLGANWLNIKDNDQSLIENLGYSDKGYLISVIPFGYAKKENSLAKLIKNKYRNSIKKLTGMGYPEIADIKSEDKIPYQLNIREFVWDYECLKKIRPEDLENSGLEGVFQKLHLAPTIADEQLWRILKAEGKLFVIVTNQSKTAKIESGIVRFYLGEALKSEGIKTTWNFIDEIEDKEKYKISDDYFVAGYYTY